MIGATCVRYALSHVTEKKPHVRAKNVLKRKNRNLRFGSGLFLCYAPEGRKSRDFQFIETPQLDAMIFKCSLDRPMLPTGDAQSSTHCIFHASQRFTPLVLITVLFPQAIDVLVARMVVSATRHGMNQVPLLFRSRRPNRRHAAANH